MVGATVAIVKAHDVVFAQVGAALHLNHLHRDLARVGEPVPAAQGDVGALVFADQLLLAILFHQRRALHHDPVFGPVVVHLQRKAGAGVDHDPLHLPAGSLGDAVIGAPGAIDLAVGLALRGPLALQQAHDPLDVLGPVAVGHQHHIVGFHHHQVFDAKPHHQAVLAAQVAVAGVFVDHPAPQHVALVVLVGGFPEGAPAAHITPARLQGQHGAPVGALHDGHVEGHVGAGGKGFPLQPQEVEVGTVLLQGQPAGADHLRHQPFELRQDGAGLEQEHAAVPGEAAGGQELLGGGPIGLLHKPGDRHWPVDLPEGLGCLDIAVASFSRGGHDPEGHQLARLRCRRAGRDRVAEGRGVANGVVRRQDQQQGVIALGRGLKCRHRHRRGRVAAYRLQQDPRRFYADLAHLLGHDEAVIFIADQQWRCQPLQALQSLLGLLQQGFLAAAGQGPILLRIAGAREGPQPGARAAAEDHRNQGADGHGSA